MARYHEAGDGRELQRDRVTGQILPVTVEVRQAVGLSWLRYTLGDEVVPQWVVDEAFRRAGIEAP